MLFISNKKREQISWVLSWCSPAQNIKAMTEGLLVYWFLVQNYAWLLQCRHSNGTLGRRLSNRNLFWNQGFSRFFSKQTDKIHSSTMCPLKTLKAFELTWPLRKQPSKFMNFMGPFAKNLRIFCFRKMLWLDDVLPSVPVWVSVLWRNKYTVIEQNLDNSSMPAVTNLSQQKLQPSSALWCLTA